MTCDPTQSLRLSGMLGLPVVRGDRMLGRVEQIVLEASGHFLRGIVLRHGLGSARWLPCRQLAVLGHVALVAQGDPTRLPSGTDFALTSVKDASGMRLGRVADVCLDPVSRAVTALEITLGPFEEWRWGRVLVREFTVRPTPEEAGQVLIPCGFTLESCFPDHGLAKEVSE